MRRPPFLGGEPRSIPPALTSGESVLEKKGEKVENEHLGEQGISPEEIARWKQITKRFESYGKDAYDFYTLPFSEKTSAFLDGESEYSKRDGKINLESNPLRLIRPYSLMSLSSYCHNNNKGYPKVWAKNRSEFGFGDTEKITDYVRLVKEFDGFATVMADTLNERDAEKRKETVLKKIKDIFTPKDASAYSKDLEKIAPDQNAEKWLTFGVLSLLNSPSDQISPAGRLRALELLSLFPLDSLQKKFRSSSDEHYGGLSHFVTARLPESFCTREERNEMDHERIWEKNEHIKKLLVRDQNRKIDWRSTATNLTETAPYEAVQVCLLFLRSFETADGALAYLANIPKLDAETKKKMFGRKASFLAELKIGKGFEDAIAQGTGTTEAFGSDLEEEMKEKNIADLKQMLRRKEKMMELLDEQLAAATTEKNRLLWENHLLRSTAGSTKPVETKFSSEKLDPQGYFRIIGLHPQAFEGLDDEAIEEMVKRQYRFFAKKYHPDSSKVKTKEVEDKFKLLNNANEVFSDKTKRARYGK